MEQIELVEQILAGQTGGLNDSHSSIFTTVSTLLGQQISTEISRATNVEAALSNAVVSQNVAISTEVSRAALAAGGTNVMNSTQLTAFFNCEGTSGSSFNSYDAATGNCINRFPGIGFSASANGQIQVNQVGYYKIQSYTTSQAGEFNSASPNSFSNGIFTCTQPGIYFFTARVHVANLQGIVEALITVNDTITDPSTGYRHIFSNINYYLNTAYCNGCTGQGYQWQDWSYDLSLPVSGAFNLTYGDQVSLYVKSTSDSSYQIQSYTSFGAIYLPGTGFAFGATHRAVNQQYTSQMAPTSWGASGTNRMNFASSTTDFDTNGGILKAPYTSVYLQGMNMNFNQMVYYGYAYSSYTNSINYNGGPSYGIAYYNQDPWTMNFDCNNYMEVGVTYNVRIYYSYYSNMPYSQSTSTWSAAALPQSMPVISFQANLNNLVYMSQINVPVKIGQYWTTAYQASYKGGSHDFSIGFDVSGGNFKVKQAGVYYCNFRGLTYQLGQQYYINSPSSLEVEMRINDVRNTAGPGYGRMGIANYNNYFGYSGYYTTTYIHSGYLKLAVGDSISVYSTSDFDGSWYWQYYYTGYGSTTLFGCTLVGT